MIDDLLATHQDHTIVCSWDRIPVLVQDKVNSWCEHGWGGKDWRRRLIVIINRSTCDQMVCLFYQWPRRQRKWGGISASLLYYALRACWSRLGTLTNGSALQFPPIFIWAFCCSTVIKIDTTTVYIPPTREWMTSRPTCSCWYQKPISYKWLPIELHGSMYCPALVSWSLSRHW